MKEKTTKKNILFTCNKCKRYNLRLSKVSFRILKDVSELDCLICNKPTKYLLDFELETESDYTK